MQMLYLHLTLYGNGSWPSYLGSSIGKLAVIILWIVGLKISKWGGERGIFLSHSNEVLIRSNPENLVKLKLKQVKDQVMQLFASKFPFCKTQNKVKSLTLGQLFKTKMVPIRSPRMWFLKNQYFTKMWMFDKYSLNYSLFLEIKKTKQNLGMYYKENDWDTIKKH